MASMRCASVDGGWAVAHETRSGVTRSSSALRKRHPLEGWRSLEILMHGREHAIEVRIRELQSQSFGNSVGFEAGAVVAGERRDRRGGCGGADVRGRSGREVAEAIASSIDHEVFARG